MPNDPFYKSPKWKALRAEALSRDHWRCTVPGCGTKATHVDHVISRRNGGASVLANLRSLCRDHDNQIKEGADGQRRRDGITHVAGCDARGYPIDPQHPWNNILQKRRSRE